MTKWGSSKKEIKTELTGASRDSKLFHSQYHSQEGFRGM